MLDDFDQLLGTDEWTPRAFADYWAWINGKIFDACRPLAASCTSGIDRLLGDGEWKWCRLPAPDGKLHILRYRPLGTDEWKRRCTSSMYRWFGHHKNIRGTLAHPRLALCHVATVGQPILLQRQPKNANTHVCRNYKRRNWTLQQLIRTPSALISSSKNCFCFLIQKQKMEMRISKSLPLWNCERG